MIKAIIISMISGTIAGMGIGGGSIFILLSTIFHIFSQREAQSYNLIMFIVVGMFASISNLKNKKINKKLFKKIIIPLCIGSMIGILIARNIDEEKIRWYFYIFMLIIGNYEIITSLKNLVKSNNKK
ncbi:MAG: sulfite exporter TauE/SafE family protein [Clostridia bacterium]|nr:sulfite exporter TauE/SafE family protein [Clostridia bacterium]